MRISHFFIDRPIFAAVVSIVFVVADDGTVGTKKVELGPIVDGLRTVRSGLAPADRVVIDGIQRARPGQKVTAEDGTIKAPAK